MMFINTSIPGNSLIGELHCLGHNMSKGRGQNYFGRDPAGSCRIPTKDDTRYFLNKLAVETQKAEVRARGG